MLSATPTPPIEGRDADVERERDWRAIAKLAGKHGIRYRTNTALVRFLADLQAIGERPHAD
ncbi:hypothetical protein [Sphingomonas sp. Leaf22]|uniref:hypothetical protein n=1 Tax=Sphingomonas sp. Leaf22 TaxID=1735687 RepID=UPI0012E20678|nr:hypothetical protein [Sphingomonas sp. Leaf22]